MIGQLIDDARNGIPVQIDVLTNGNAVTPFVPADRNRVALIISGPQTGTITLGFGKDPALAAGYRMPVAAPPLMLTLRDHGPLVQCEVRAFSTAVQTITALAWIAGSK